MITSESAVGDTNNAFGVGAPPVLTCFASGVTFSTFDFDEEAAVLADAGFRSAFRFLLTPTRATESGVVAGVVAFVTAESRDLRCSAAPKAEATTCSIAEAAEKVRSCVEMGRVSRQYFEVMTDRTRVYT